MSIFKEHKTNADRSATDRSRHKQKIKEALREGVYDIVSDESIIGQDGKKRIRIPVRGIKEYRFIYGENEANRKSGSAPGTPVKRGQTIGRAGERKPTADSPGNEKGVEYYEVEITLEELSAYLFDDLDLPDIERKRLKNIIGEKSKRSGYRKKGIRPRLSKKETVKNKIRRMKRSIKNGTYDPDERFTFHDEDLKYRYLKKVPKESSNAVIFFMMDTSGSMTKEKKFLARSFFFVLFHFLNYKYTNVDVVFISHDSEAREVSEDDFFKKGSAGGTIVSSALQTCVNAVISRYHPDSWNIYAFHCSDGDNWPSDNDKACDLSCTIRDFSQLYCFIEITPEDEKLAWDTGQSSLSKSYESLIDSRFKMIHIFGKRDIWPAFKRIFGGKIDE